MERHSQLLWEHPLVFWRPARPSAPSALRLEELRRKKAEAEQQMAVRQKEQRLHTQEGNAGYILERTASNGEGFHMNQVNSKVHPSRATSLCTGPKVMTIPWGQTLEELGLLGSLGLLQFPPKSAKTCYFPHQ